jgi:hypothetical protein
MIQLDRIMIYPENRFPLFRIKLWARQSSGPPRSSAAPNLPLAAHRRVRHIGPTGDVAEWLKAAVC